MRTSQQGTSDAVERMKRYIDAHLQDQVTARSLADAAGYSLFHAARLFREATGRTPFEYLRERRLLGSALALRNGEARVIDVAFDFMFNSHAGFTRAFTKAFGIAPKRFAAAPRPSGWLIPYRVQYRGKREEEREMSTKTAVIFTQIVERPARKLLLRRSAAADDYFSYCDEFGCAENGDSVPWTVLSSIKEALYEPVGAWLPENLRPAGTGSYAHGVELPADYSATPPDGFEIIDLAPCEMLVFQGEPYDDEEYGDAIGAFWERVKTFNPVVYGYEYADEAGPRMQLEPQGWRGYIELRPVRKIV